MSVRIVAITGLTCLLFNISTAQAQCGCAAMNPNCAVPPSCGYSPPAPCYHEQPCQAPCYPQQAPSYPQQAPSYPQQAPQRRSLMLPPRRSCARSRSLKP